MSLALSESVAEHWNINWRRAYFGETEVGGMMITPDSLETEGAPKPLGSCIIYEAESLDAVKKMVESDVYYTAGVVSTRLVFYVNDEFKTLLTGKYI